MAEISWQSLWRIFAMAALALALFLIREVLVILFLAIIISSSLDGIVSFLKKLGVPRILGTLAIFSVVFAILFLVLYNLIPITLMEARGFLEKFNLEALPIIGPVDSLKIFQSTSQSLQGWTQAFFSGGVSFLDTATKLFGNIILLFTTIVLSFYLTVSQEGVEKFFRSLLPLNYEDYVLDIYYRVRRKLGAWLQAELFLMLIVGILVSVGLWLLGVKYSLLLGVLAGILEIVPIAGPIFAGVLIFFSAVSESVRLGIYTIILMLAVQQLENHLLVPVVMKKAFNLSPVLVVLSILAGYALAGLVGIILAVPILLVMQELLYDYEQNKLKIKSSKLNI